MASNLVIRIGADLSALSRSLTQAENQLKRFSFRAERIGRDLTTRVSLPILAIGGAAVKSFADFDKMEKGLSAIAGSAEEGSRQFKELLSLVKDTRTTLDLSTAANASLQLQSVGLAASDANRLLQGFGLAATVSGKGVEDVGGAVRQFTQVLAKGSIEQEDFITIAERIPFIGNLIRNELGFKTAEEIRNSGISMDDFVKKVIVAAEKSSVLAGASGGLSGAFTALKIGLQEAAFTFGGAISKALNLEENLTKLADVIGGLANKFANLNPGLQKFIVFTASAVAAIGPLFLGLGAVARALPLLRSGFSLLLAPITGMGGALAALASPIGIAVAAIGAIAAVAVYAYKNSSTFQVQIDALFSSFKELGAAVLQAGKVLLNVLDNVLFPFSSGIKVIGGAAKIVVGILSGLIAVIAKVITVVSEQLTNTFSGFADIASGNFKSGIEKLSNSLANPLNLLKVATAGKALGETFGNTFKETVASFDSDLDTPFKATVEPVIQPVDNTTTKTGSGNQTPAAAQQILPGQIDGVNVLALSLQQVSRDTEYLQGKIDALKPTIQEDIFAPYRDGLDLISAKQEAFGGSYDALGEKISLVKGLISSMVEEDYPANIGAVEVLTEQLRALTTVQDEQVAAIERVKDIMQQLSSVAGTAFGSVTQSMAKGASAAKAFGIAVVSAIRDAISAKIKLAVTEAAASVFAKVPFPLSVGLAAAAGAGASGIFNSILSSLKIPLLADGGITQGAGLFVAGEAGPEAIIPLDRLNEFMRPSGGQISGVLRADGNELIAVIDTVNAQNSRSF